MNINLPCPKEKSGGGLKSFGSDVTIDWGVCPSMWFALVAGGKTGGIWPMQLQEKQLQHMQSQEMLFVVDAIAGEVIA